MINASLWLVTAMAVVIFYFYVVEENPRAEGHKQALQVIAMLVTCMIYDWGVVFGWWRYFL